MYMPWYPFTLSPPEVQPWVESEAYAQTVLHRFLKRHFTGVPVDVWESEDDPAISKTFDSVEFAYNVEDLKGDSPWIHSQLVNMTNRDRDCGGGVKDVERPMSWSIMVRVAADGDQSQEDDWKVAKIAADLFWLLSSPNKAAMSQLGFGRIRVQPPVPIIMPGYKVRQVLLNAVLFAKMPTRNP